MGMFFCRGRKWSVGLKLVVIAGLMLAGEGITRGQNFVMNPGFESLNSSGWALNWDRDTTAYVIQKKLYYKNTNPDNYVLCHSATFSVIPGSSYVLNGWLSCQNVTGPVSDRSGATICFEWKDSNGNWIGGIYPAGIIGYAGWTNISSTSPAMPSNAYKGVVTCYFRPGYTGEAWWDDISLVRVGTSTNLLANPGFETLNSSGMAVNWVGSGYSVQKMLYYQNTDPANYRICSNGLFAVQPGKRYILNASASSMDVVGSDSAGGTVFANLLDQNGNTVSGLYPSGVMGYQGWTTIHLVSSAMPVNVANCKVNCYLRQTDTGKVWWDNISFTKVPLLWGCTTNCYRGQTAGGNVMVRFGLNRDEYNFGPEDLTLFEPTSLVLTSVPQPMGVVVILRIFPRQIFQRGGNIRWI
jgi:hypothetical protein